MPFELIASEFILIQTFAWMRKFNKFSTNNIYHYTVIYVMVVMRECKLIRYIDIDIICIFWEGVSRNGYIGSSTNSCKK